MIGLEDFRREVLRYNTLMLDLYDQGGGNLAPDLLRLAHVHDNRTLRDNPVRFDLIMNIPEVHEWTGQLPSALPAERMEFTVPLRGYGGHVLFNKINVGRPSTIGTLEKTLAGLPNAYLHKRIEMVASVLERNPLCMDGQNLFDSDHPRPQGRGTYSNQIVGAATTPESALNMLKQVSVRFAENGNVLTKYVKAPGSKLLVLTKTEAQFQAFEEVRTQDKLPPDAGSVEVPNRYKGQIEVWKTNTGQSDIDLYFIQDSPSRPVVLVDDQDPTLDVVQNEGWIPNDHVAVVYRGIFSAAPMIPLSVIRAVDAG